MERAAGDEQWLGQYAINSDGTIVTIGAKYE